MRNEGWETRGRFVGTNAAFRTMALGLPRVLRRLFFQPVADIIHQEARGGALFPTPRPDAVKWRGKKCPFLRIMKEIPDSAERIPYPFVNKASRTQTSLAAEREILEGSCFVQIKKKKKSVKTLIQLWCYWIKFFCWDFRILNLFEDLFFSFSLLKEDNFLYVLYKNFGIFSRRRGGERGNTSSSSRSSIGDRKKFRTFYFSTVFSDHKSLVRCHLHSLALGAFKWAPDLISRRT